ncbi:MAG: class I SAM-dependent methyltransferase [Firmicutes bacterium]|nr:class I SAM-dependent methyltransferase [Bacillota bacterium]
MNLIELSHKFLQHVIMDGDFCIDATMGNGNDTLFLASLGARVFAFDVQDRAIQNTKRLLEENNFNATLVKDGHENVDKHVKTPIKAAIFNLGYLPKSDKSIITKPDTTIIALHKITNLLQVGGRIAIMVYIGHEGGKAEESAVLEWVDCLAKDKWQIEIHKMHDKPTSPFLICLEKFRH